MPAVFGRAFGDSCLRSFVDAESTASGRLAWTKRIHKPDAGPAEANLLLTDGKLIIVDCLQELVAFDANGVMKWSRPKWYGCHVSLRNDRIFYTSPQRKDDMEAIDLNNQLVMRETEIPGIYGGGYLALFEPYENCLIAQAQDPGDPHNLPRNYIVYKTTHGGIGYDWSAYHQPGESLIMPLINWNSKRLITSVYEEALTYDIDSTEREAQPIVRFPLPLGANTAWLSSDGEKTLYWVGFEESNLTIIATDYNGTELWRHLIAEAAQPYILPMAPVMVGRSRQWVLTQTALQCFAEGRHLWRFDAQQTYFRSAVVLGDESVLISCTTGLLKVTPSGEQEFHLEFEDTLVTPPIINDTGRIFVASKEAIYAFD